MRDLRYIFSYLGKYRKDLYIAIFLIFIETCFELVIPMLMASLIDDGVAKADVSFMLKDGLLMIICALLALFTGLTYARFSSRAAYGLGANIREAEYRKIQSFSFSNIDSNNPERDNRRTQASCQKPGNALSWHLLLISDER